MAQLQCSGNSNYHKLNLSQVQIINTATRFSLTSIISYVQFSALTVISCLEATARPACRRRFSKASQLSVDGHMGLAKSYPLRGILSMHPKAVQLGSATHGTHFVGFNNVRTLLNPLQLIKQ